jgi:hypothetical protein
MSKTINYDILITIFQYIIRVKPWTPARNKKKKKKKTNTLDTYDLSSICIITIFNLKPRFNWASAILLPHTSGQYKALAS